MTLPRMDTPTFHVTLPVTNTPVTFRPYLTKEEKLLLMAVESKDPKSVMSAIRQVAINCIVEPKDLNVDNLPMADVDYLFLNLRAKSKGEVLEANFNCRHIPEGEEKECGNLMQLSVRVDELKVNIPKDFTTTIPLNDKIGIVMRLPRYADISSASTNDKLTAIDKSFQMIKSSIAQIYDGEQVFDVNSAMDKDLEEFIGSLNSEQFKKIEGFFESMPKIDYKFDVACKKCGFEHHINYRDIASFF